MDVPARVATGAAVTEVMQFPFRGIDQSDDPKALPPGTLLTAENCAMDKGRRLCKRRGTTGLTRATFDAGVAGSNLSTANHLLTRGDDLAIVDPEYSRTYSSERLKWQKVGRPPNLKMTRRGLVDSTRSVSQVDVIAYGNLLVTLFVTGYANVAAPYPSLFIQVEDIETGALVLPPTLLVTGAAWPRLHVFGTSVHFTCSDVNGSVIIGEFSMSTLTLVGGLNSVAATGLVYTPCDSVLSSDGVTMYLVYGLGAGVNRLEVAAWTVATATLAFAAVQYSTASADAISVGCALSADNAVFHVIYAAAVAPILRSLSTVNLTTSVGPTSISNGVTAGTSTGQGVSVRVDGANLLVAALGGNTTGLVSWRLRTSLRTAAAHTEDAASVRITSHPLGMGRPFKLASRWYMLLVVAPWDHSLVLGTEIPTASSVIVEIPTATSIASIAGSPHAHAGTVENQTGWPPTRTGTSSQVAVVGSVAYVAAAYRNREPISFHTIPIGWNLHRVEVSTEARRLAVAGRGGLCPGAAPYWFDGYSTLPYGFVHAPLILSISHVAAVTTVAAGDYSYVAVYEWRDASGVLHRSIPSSPRSVTAVAGDSITITVATSTLSQHQLPPYGAANASAANPVSIALYRTTVGGTVFYRLTSEPDSQLLFNDPTAASVALTDTKADADIGPGGTAALALSAQAQLYTAVGELADVPPPALVTCATHRGRLVGIGSDLRTVWFSKDATEDATVAPGFNEALTLAFARDKTALASLDDKLVVFGESAIDVVFGDGPDSGGQSSTWQIAAVQSDVGCVNAKSVCTAPTGAVFESSRGIEMLSRELTVTWIGKVIEDTLAAYPTITSAVLVADEQEVRFTCTAVGGATGIVLAWNYAYNIWFTRKYADLAATSAASIPFVDAALIDGVYTMLTAAGQVYQETSSHKLDNGTGFVGRDVVLAPISPAGNQSWHRVQQVSLLGTSVTNHDLTVSIARDYATSYEQTETFLAGSVATTVGPLEQCRVTLAKQKCQAIKIRIQDVTPTTPGTYPVSTGDGPILEAVALRVGIKPGTPRTAAGQQR